MTRFGVTRRGRRSVRDRWLVGILAGAGLLGFIGLVDPAAIAAAEGKPGKDRVRVQLSVAPSRVEVGDRVAVTVSIFGATDVAHVPFNVTFDPSVLRFEGGSEGSFLRGGGADATMFVAAPSRRGGMAVVGLSRLGQEPGVDGDGPLCTLEFIAVAAGDAALAFSDATVRDSANRIVPSRFQPVRLTVSRSPE